jgi:nucleotide-binding universal stress UspA family protein
MRQLHMALYDRILVPTDGSDGVERAVQHAVDLAVEHGATVHALYVINAASYAGLPMEASLEGVDEMLRADAEDAVATVESIADDFDVPTETAIRDGEPSKRIVQYAEAENCDLIVMATHGRGGIDRLLLGSVAEGVVRSAEIPVMTLRLSDE